MSDCTQRRLQPIFAPHPTHLARAARYESPSTELDLTASYRLFRHWTIYAEVQNALSAARRGYNGDANLRLDYNEYADWSATFGIRWKL